MHRVVILQNTQNRGDAASMQQFLYGLLASHPTTSLPHIHHWELIMRSNCGNGQFLMLLLHEVLNSYALDPLALLWLLLSRFSQIFLQILHV